LNRWFLAILACALLISGISAQTPPDAQPSTRQQTAQKSEETSPELIEAQKLNVEVLKLYKAGNYEEATQLAKRVLQTLEKALKPGDQQLSSALYNLGELYLARRKYGEAEGYYQRLLANYEQASRQNRTAMAKALDRLGFLNYMRLDFDDAEKFYQRSLALREQEQNSGKLEVATSLFNLAEFYRLRGDYEKAEPFYKRAIEIKGKALGPEDKDVELALERYSCLYYAMNRQDEWKAARSQFSFISQKDKDADDNEEILNGKAIDLPIPAYPQEAKQSRLSGVVVIKISVDETGKVTKAGDMCGSHPLLVGAAVGAAYKARFTPTLLAGAPVPVSGLITYRFVTK
jgi:TonB family protein